MAHIKPFCTYVIQISHYLMHITCTPGIHAFITYKICYLHAKPHEYMCSQNMQQLSLTTHVFNNAAMHSILYIN